MLQKTLEWDTPHYLVKKWRFLFQNKTNAQERDTVFEYYN